MRKKAQTAFFIVTPSSGGSVGKGRRGVYEERVDRPAETIIMNNEYTSHDCNCSSTSCSPYSPCLSPMHPSLFSYATCCRQFGLTCRSGHRVRHNRSAASICTGCHRRAHHCRRHTGSHGSPAAPDTVACCRCDSERSRRDNCRECCSVAFVA